MKFSEILLGWYSKNKRDLPWRQTRDPYKIWLSEIIMQQTRVEQGLSYYLKFVKKYPEIKSLANAKEEDVLRLWQGLGYYSRARNLHNTANSIVKDFNGQFPETYSGLIKLKGIGEYTAAAIVSLAYNQVYPVADGNVIRFLSRYFGIKTPVNSEQGKKEILGLAGNLIDTKLPGEFNQAIMEFGALYCKPKYPDCKDCVFNSECLAFKQNFIDVIPVKIRRTSRKKRYFHYLVITGRNNSIYLKQRTENDIWRNLYDFPLLEKETKTTTNKLMKEISERLFVNINEVDLAVPIEYKHVLTHQIIFARFYKIEIPEATHFNRIPSLLKVNMIQVDTTEIHNYPVPRLMEKFLKNIYYL
jgi:A/G-specific adenine glycosylase